jgi:hypothetical protein
MFSAMASWGILDDLLKAVMRHDVQSVDGGNAGSLQVHRSFPRKRESSLGPRLRGDERESQHPAVIPGRERSERLKNQT